MDKVKQMVMAIIPVALGVTAGMMLFEAAKKAQAAKAVSA